MRNRKITKIKSKKRNKIFTPETKIKEIQVQINRIDCPRSGCRISNKTIADNKIKEIKYDKFIFLVHFKPIICATIRTKNGLINSIGWKRKLKKFNHLFAPLISTPIKGTSINITKKIKKIGNRLLFTKLVLSADIKIIIEKEMLAYKKCFWKKK